MVDTVQRGVACTPHHDPNADRLDFGHGFANYDSGNNGFMPMDVNAENASLQKFLRADVQEVPALTPGASSRTTSYLTDSGSETQQTLWIPQAAGLRPTAYDVHANDVPWFEDVINKDAYEPSAIATPESAADAFPPFQVQATPSHVQAMQPPELYLQTRDINAEAGGIPFWNTEVSPVMDSSRTNQVATQPITIIRSLSKRDRQDTSGTVSGLTRQISKRHKAFEGGFACEGCKEIFDRACDRAKHFKRTHAGEESRPHSCPKCFAVGLVKKFLYPKDVRRHLKQVHKVSPESISPVQPTDASENTAPTSPTSPSAASFWTLTKAVQRFKNLRISASSPTNDAAEDKYIMVSADSENFKEVAFNTRISADTLASRILAALGLREQELHAQSYTRKRGAIQLGDTLNRHRLLSLVSQAADPQGSLKLLIHTSRQPHVPMSTPAEMSMLRW